MCVPVTVCVCVLEAFGEEEKDCIAASITTVTGTLEALCLNQLRKGSDRSEDGHLETLDPLVLWFCDWFFLPALQLLLLGMVHTKIDTPRTNDLNQILKQKRLANS